MNQSESILQMTIVSMLRTLYPEFVINLSLNGISLTGLSPKQKAQIIAQAKREGMEKGLPDLSLYITDGQVLNLELKVGKNDQSEDQLAIQSKLANLGHNYYVIRDYQSVFAIIAEHVLPDYRQAAFEALHIPSSNGLLTKQFLHFPPNTPLSEVHDLLKQLYYI